MLAVATEQHQVQWLRDAANDGEAYSEHRTGSGTGESADIPGWAVLGGFLRDRQPRPSGVLSWPGSVPRRCANPLSTPGSGCESATALVSVQNPAGGITAQRVVLTTNVFPSLLRRNRLHTIPVYDHVLGTQPLGRCPTGSHRVGRREGISDSGNQFHYYRLSADNRILWGGYDAAYYYGRRWIRTAKTGPSHSERSRVTSSHLPATRRRRFSHRWSGPIDTNTRFCAHWGRPPVAVSPTSTGSPAWGRRSPVRRRRVSVDLLDGQSAPSGPGWRWCDANRRSVCPSRWPASGSRPPDGRWTGPDHHGGRRNVLLRTLDRMGLGSTPEVPGNMRLADRVGRESQEEKQSWRHTQRRTAAGPGRLDHVAQRCLHPHAAGGRQPRPAPRGEAVWATGTDNQGADRADVQKDGNLRDLCR